MKIDIKVKKRDGTIEEYAKEKIKKVVLAAGLDDSESEKLLTEIDNWLKGRNFKVITSIKLRDRVATELKKLNEYAYNKYIWWQKYKEDHFNK